jgi:hypothetical protein
VYLSFVVACIAPLPTASSAEDCDAEGLAKFEDDCGYWDTTTGTFVYWYWVTPGYGGNTPAGWHPWCVR